MVEQSNLVSARFEQVEAKLYEIVGRLQLLTVCLIALFLGVLVWQISLARSAPSKRSVARLLLQAVSASTAALDSTSASQRSARSA
jgi:hypothetical protein